MPARLRRQLEANKDQGVSGIVSVLAASLGHDNDISQACLCHRGVLCLGRTEWKGHRFCGCRNVQMLASYVQATKPPGWEGLGNTLPNISTIENLVEDA